MKNGDKGKNGEMHQRIKNSKRSLFSAQVLKNCHCTLWALEKNWLFWYELNPPSDQKQGTHPLTYNKSDEAHMKY